MKLRDFFSTSAGSEMVTTAPEDLSAGSEAAKYKLLQQIRAMTPGQTLQGKIIGRENGQVQIQLACELTFSARLETEIPIDLGKTMTFQVKNNGKGLTLSPLFANMSTDENVIKALDMAGIPVSERTIAMTESMMREGLSIDKQSLQTMLRLVYSFPEAAPETIVQLQKLSVPVTSANLEQAENYQALSHQIEKGLQALAEGLDTFTANGFEQGQAAETIRLLEAVVKAVFGGESADNTSLPQGGLPAGESALQTEGTAQVPVKTEETDTAVRNTGAGAAENGSAAKNPSMTAANILLQLKQLAADGAGAGQLAGKIQKQLGKELVSLLNQELQEQFSIKPDEVGKSRAVQELYEQVHRQLSGLEEAVSSAAGKENILYKGVTQLRNNLDFMQQLNQVFHFVQLPLKMNERNAHGDLYVYTNKKNLAQKEGSISAFLHLDMEHLGSVDIYVTMEEQKVGTRFVLRDDEMLSFLHAHMNILDERLQKRGYSLSYEMKVQEEAQEQGVLDTILSQNRGGSMLSQHAFDVRA